MELGLDFDDSFFTEKVRQKPTLTSYNAKVCYPEWFLSDQADNGRNDMATIYKFRGDYYYHRKDMESAIQCYKSSLDNLGIHNRTMRRELMESLARCNMQIGQFEISHQYIECVMSDLLTIEHYCQLLLLQRQLYRCSGDIFREVSVIQQLISIHPDNSQFWLKLAEVYEKVRDLTQSTSACTNPENASNRCQNKDGASIHLKGNSCVTQFKSVTCQEGSELVKEGDVVKKFMCTINAGNNVHSKECSSSTYFKDQDTNKCTVHMLQIGDLYEVKEEQTSRCIGSFSETLSTYPVDMILLTCYVRTRLKLLSVQGTVGSFIKDKNRQLVEMMDCKIRSLSLKDSTLDHVTQYIRPDMTEEETDEEESKPDQSQDIKVIMENKITMEDFNNRWFSWIKEIS